MAQLEYHPLFTDELHFIVAALHPWAKAKRVERSEIPRQNYILYNKRNIPSETAPRVAARKFVFMMMHSMMLEPIPDQPVIRFPAIGVDGRRAFDLAMHHP